MYRYDKATAEERGILKEEGLNVLLGDCNLDGFFTMNDYDLFKKFYYDENWSDYKGTARHDFANFDGDTRINMRDGNRMKSVLSYLHSMSRYHEAWYACYGY